MIIQIDKGRTDFGGTMWYAINKPREPMAALIGGNVSPILPHISFDDFPDGEPVDPNVANQASAEMQAVADQKRKIKEPGYFFNISWAKGESVTNSQMVTAVEMTFEAWGIDPDNFQHVMIRHDNTEYQHVHVLLNRVGLDGQVFLRQRDAHIARKAQDDIIKKMGFTPNEYKDKNVIKRSPGEYHMVQEGRPDFRGIAHDAVKNAIEQSDGTFLDFNAVLLKENIVNPNWEIAPSGRIFGGSFQVVDSINPDEVAYFGGKPMVFSGKDIGWKGDEIFGALAEMRVRLQGVEPGKLISIDDAIDLRDGKELLPEIASSTDAIQGLGDCKNRAYQAVALAIQSSDGTFDNFKHILGDQKVLDADWNIAKTGRLFGGSFKLIKDMNAANDEERYIMLDGDIVSLKGSEFKWSGKRITDALASVRASLERGEHAGQGGQRQAELADVPTSVANEKECKDRMHHGIANALHASDGSFNSFERELREQKIVSGKFWFNDAKELTGGRFQLLKENGSKSGKDRFVTLDGVPVSYKGDQVKWPAARIRGALAEVKEALANGEKPRKGIELGRGSHESKEEKEARHQARIARDVANTKFSRYNRVPLQDNKNSTSAPYRLKLTRNRIPKFADRFKMLDELIQEAAREDDRRKRKQGHVLEEDERFQFADDREAAQEEQENDPYFEP